MRVTVIGAGVIGLLTAHELAHRSHHVTIVARDVGNVTTSAHAGASFKPSSVPRTELYLPLLRSSREVLDGWMTSGFASELGISAARHVEASVRPLEPRDYLDVMRDVRVLGAGDSIPGGYPFAISYRTYFFDVPVTMAALTAHMADAHGLDVHEAAVASLDDEAITGTGPDAVVNASGLGARELASDPGLVAVKGQTVLVATRGHVPDFSISADGIYLYPRRRGILLGGTAEIGTDDTTVDAGTTQLLMAANARVLPELLDAEILDTRAGLRPYRRAGVRLEVDQRRSVPLIHAYGHGGSGWTLGAGTATWVSDALDRIAS